MAEIGAILYVKAEQAVDVKKREITLGDILSMECTDKKIIAKLKTIKFANLNEERGQRIVVSLLELIACIQVHYPKLEICSLGASDVIVTYKPDEKKHKMVEILKVVFVVVVSFIGAAFAIMSFNNDSGITELFDQIYELFVGQKKTGVSVLELSYSVGLIIGILVFFQHFGKRKKVEDPTPMEIEMRLYEKDIQTTLIEDAARKEKGTRADKTNRNGNRRT